MIQMQQADNPFTRALLTRCPNWFNHRLPTSEEIQYRPQPKPAGPPEPTQEEIAARQAEERKEKIQARLKVFLDHDCGPRYATATFDTYQPATKSQQMALDAIKAQSEGVCSFSSNIVLYGPCGSGKDHLLISLARCAIEQEKTVRWFFGVSLFRKLRDRIGSQYGSESTIIDSMIDPDILILSDPVPPEASVSDYQRSTLLEVLDHRYRHCKPTWVTLNVCDREEAEERIGGQAIDRLWSDSVQILCSGPSGRKPK